MNDKPDCYGKMFPDLDQLDDNRPFRGKVFRVLVESKGIGVFGRNIEADPKAWEQCVACECYRDCYDMSMAKMLLRLALNN
jgi:hypothetical protein